MKSTIVILIFLLLGTNGFWLYNAVDRGVTETYAGASSDLLQKQYEQAVHIANLNIIGMHADDALDLLNPDVYGLEPFEKEGCIIAGQVCIQLNKDRVIVNVSPSQQ